jgi:hypothetical protein
LPAASFPAAARAKPEIFVTLPRAAVYPRQPSHIMIRFSSLAFLRPAQLAAAALLALAAAPLHAAYKPGTVGADARWVVHADFDALRASVVGKELVAAVEKAQSGAAADGMKSVVGLDIARVLETIGAVTAYGTNLAKDPQAVDGALIAQGKPELRKIAESLLLQGTIANPKVFAEATDWPFPAYTISDPNAKTADKTQVIVAFPPEPFVIVSKNKATVLKARAVLRGEAPSLAKTADAPLNRLGAKAAGAYLYGATVVPTEDLFGPNAPQTRMLQLAGAGSLALGERGPDVYAHAELLASSSANAEKLMKILQGMTAMLSLAETTDKQLADFLNSTAVSRQGDTVILDLAYSSTRLAAMAKSLQTVAAPRPAAGTGGGPRPALITMGRKLAEWTAAEAAATPATNGFHVRTVEGVALTNGATVSVGRALNGGNTARFESVEIVPAGGGAPLVFKAEFMRTTRQLQQFQFPGVDGTYTLKVAFVNDPTGKAQFALSVNDPKAPPAVEAK